MKVFTIRHGKVKFQLRTGHESPESGYRYSSTLSLNSAPDGGGWLTPRPAALPPDLSRCPGPVSTRRKISPTLGFDRRTFQPVASLYTQYVIPAYQACSELDFPRRVFPSVCFNGLNIPVCYIISSPGHDLLAVTLLLIM